MRPPCSLTLTANHCRLTPTLSFRLYQRSVQKRLMTDSMQLAIPCYAGTGAKDACDDKLVRAGLLRSTPALKARVGRPRTTSDLWSPHNPIKGRLPRKRRSRRNLAAKERIIVVRNETALRLTFTATHCGLTPA